MKKGIRKKVKCILAAALVFAVSCTNVPVTAYAQEGQQLTWTHTGDGWHYLNGTDIKVKLENNAAYIYGTGALPDFDYWRLHERPWANGSTEAVYIAETITSIGKYAFYDMEKLKYIDMYTGTFIKDSTCFDKISYEPIYRLRDCAVNTEMIGTIPYTSLDSILTIAQTNYNGAAYILDTYAKAKEFQNSTNPTVTNVYYAGQTVEHDGETIVPWSWVETYGNGNETTVICRLSAETPYPSVVVSAQKRYQGRACLEAYAAFIEDYTFAATFNVSVAKTERVIYPSYQYWVDNKVEQTDTELKYVLTIPEEFRLPGRSFRLLAIGNGEVRIYDDLDLADDTITFATNTPSTAYALVYR